MSSITNYSFSSVAVDVTYKCNFRCLHCFNSSGEHDFNRDELNDHELMNVIKQLAEFDIDSICFCGGEPLLRKDIILAAGKFLKENAKRKLNINMVTNGYLMTTEIAKQLKESGFRFIQVSVDGIDSKTHDWIRQQNNSFNKAINAIKILAAEGLYVGIACTPTKKNIHMVDDLIDLAISLKVREFRMQPIMNLGRASKISEYFPEYSDYLKLGRKLIQKNITTPELNIEWGDPVLHIIGGRNDTMELSYFNVNAYGDITISPYLPISFGNVKKYTLKEYLEKGLLDAWKFGFVKKITKNVNSAETLNVSLENDIIPEIFTNKDISFDLVDNDTKLLNDQIIEKYNL